jgi:hypothetical protein
VVGLFVVGGYLLVFSGRRSWFGGGAGAENRGYKETTGKEPAIGAASQNHKAKEAAKGSPPTRSERRLGHPDPLGVNAMRA